MMPRGKRDASKASACTHISNACAQHFIDAMIKNYVIDINQVELMW